MTSSSRGHRYNLPVIRVKALSKRDIERIARHFLARHFPNNLKRPTKLDALYLLEEVLPALGAQFEVKEVLHSNVFAFTCAETKRVVLSEYSYQSARRGEGHGLFTAAHETFHWIQHVAQLVYQGVRIPLVQGQFRARVARAAMNVPPYEDPEWQADEGAACLLVPEPTLRSVMSVYGPDPDTVKDLFGVSYTCARKRVDRYVAYCKNKGIPLPY